MHLVHTKLSELLAFRRTIALARRTGAGVYFVHTSAQEGVEAIAEARAKGLPVYGETLHQYACFNAEYYKTPRGFCSHTYPSLKFPEDQAALWNGLVQDGAVDAGHRRVPDSLELKLAGQGPSRTSRAATSGAEARMGIGWSEGVVKRGMSLERFADVTSTNAARIFGLYPRRASSRRQRRRPRPDRPAVRQDADARRLPRDGLQPVGRLGGDGLAGDHDAARQGRGRQAGKLLGSPARRPARSRARSTPRAAPSRLLIRIPSAMAVTVRFVGSGDSFGSGGRFQTCILVDGPESRFAIDFGTSSLVALAQQGIAHNSIDAIVLSHLHGDHAGGVPFLLIDAMLAARRERPLTIAGPRDLRRRMAEIQEALFPGSHVMTPKFALHWIEMEPGAPHACSTSGHGAAGPAYGGNESDGAADRSRR